MKKTLRLDTVTGPLLSGRDGLLQNMSNDPKEFVNELRREWKTMWRAKFEDKVRAEGIADKNYELLFVERGLVLFDSRTLKALEFHEILEKHLTPELAERFNPNPVRGGIGKFIKDYITVRNNVKKKMREETRTDLKTLNQAQQSNEGKGWLHLSMSKT